MELRQILRHGLFKAAARQDSTSETCQIHLILLTGAAVPQSPSLKGVIIFAGQATSTPISPLRRTLNYLDGRVPRWRLAFSSSIYSTIQISAFQILVCRVPPSVKSAIWKGLPPGFLAAAKAPVLVQG